MKLPKLPDLLPGVKVRPWRLGDPNRESASDEYQKNRLSMLRRDNYTCVFCGFKSIADKEADPSTLKASGYLEGHHLDNDHHNNVLENLASTCPFCHSVFHIGHAGHNHKIKIILFPYLSQSDLNLLVNGLAVAISRGGAIGEDARALITSLQAYEGPVVKEFTAAMSDPPSFATALMGVHKANPKLYAQRGKALAHIRILPVIEEFERAVTWWSETNWLPGKDWERQWQRVYELYRKTNIA